MAGRAYRLGIQALTKAPEASRAYRQDAQVAYGDTGTAGGRAARLGAQVLAAATESTQVYRQDAQVAYGDAGSADTARVFRAGFQALTKVPSVVRSYRQDAQVAYGDTGSQPARTQRIGIQVLARQGIPPIQPLAYPERIDLFLANWANNVTLETVYNTDVSRSPGTLAEERRALVQRPSREIQIQWLRGNKRELERLYNRLRRVSQERSVVPLYMDAVIIDYQTGGNTLGCEVEMRRFHEGGRVAVFPDDGSTHFETSDFDVYTIKEVLPGHLVLNESLARDYSATDHGWGVVPLMDTELAFELALRKHTEDTGATNMLMDEVNGQSALPPLSSSPVAVFEPDIDWAGGVSTIYQRYGHDRERARGRIVSGDGERYVVRQQFNVLGRRSDWHYCMRQFDACRGKAVPFTQIDQGFTWTLADIDTQFVDIVPIGDFEDFVAANTGRFGIVMEDGRIYVRTINTVSDNGSVWRLTLGLGEELPTGDIDLSAVRRVSRARWMRFMEDSMTETWLTTDVVRLSFATIEVLQEKAVDIG